MELEQLELSVMEEKRFIKKVYGSSEFIRGTSRYCLWLNESNLGHAIENKAIESRVTSVATFRLQSKDSGTKKLASFPHKFREQKIGLSHTIIIPSVSSEIAW